MERSLVLENNVQGVDETGDETCEGRNIGQRYVREKMTVSEGPRAHTLSLSADDIAKGMNDVDETGMHGVM